MVRTIASGVGVGFAPLSSDYSEANYSSLRESRLHECDHWRKLHHWWEWDFEQPIHRRFCRMAVLSGELDLSIDRLAKYSKADFYGRGWDWVDPQKEVAAAIAAIESGIGTRSEAVAKRGRNYAEVAAELAADNETAEEAGLDLTPEEPQPVNDDE